jgi:Lrp/AsnC family transcriptional regulator, leucine-responsive regulatory protein
MTRAAHGAIILHCRPYGCEIMAAIALDAFDIRLLRLLQDDARLSHVALSERVHLSPSQCARRLQRLEQAGVVEGYAVRLDDRLVGLGVTALVNITLERHGESPAATLHGTLEALPEVVECLLITGDADYQLRVIVPDLESFSAFIIQKLMRIPGITGIRTSIVLEKIKPFRGLPLPDGGGA